MNVRSLGKIGLVLLILLIGGCGKTDEAPVASKAPAPAPAAATTPAPAAPAPAAPAAPAPVASPAPAPPPSSPRPGVLASQEFNQDPTLRCDVLEVKRVSGNALLVRWRLSKVAATEKPTYHGFGWDSVYVVDPAENKKYFGMRDSGGAWIGQGENKYYGAVGDQQAMWMKFPAPPAASTKITFVIGGFPPFDDLPVM